MVNIKTLFLIFTILLLSGIPVQANDKPEPARTGFFPFSVWYSGGKARPPMLSDITPQSEEEWRHDLKQIRALGFNTIRTWVEWAKCEPLRGEYNFENLHLLMKLAEEIGLQVFIQIYVDSPPDWAMDLFPHYISEAQNKRKVNQQSVTGLCPDDPEAEEIIITFFTETAKVASSYPNLSGWGLWSEPRPGKRVNPDSRPDAHFCRCPGTRTRFRHWLMDKYGSLDSLNRAWYRSYSTWSQIDPPMSRKLLTYTDFSDWKTFFSEKLADDMRTRYEAIRKADPNSLITAHTANASLFLSPLGPGEWTDDFLMSEPPDFYGVSIYPKHNQPDRHWSVTKLRAVMDFTRSANREKGGWHAGELQAGKGIISLFVSEPVLPEDHRIWIWSAIAKGAKGVNMYAYYPMSSGYEAGGYGLINLDGEITERAVHAGEIASIVDRNQELFLFSTPVKAEIGIVYNPLSQMVGGMQHSHYPDAHTNSLLGYFRAFADQNIPVDFIHRKHLEKQELADYKLVLVPWPLMITKEAAEGIRVFVENGGHILAEARIGRKDERGYASEIIPGLGLHDVFGVREHEVSMRDDVGLVITDTAHPAISNLDSGNMLSGALYAKSVAPLENREIDILARHYNGKPAIVSAKYGKGQAILAGTYLGMANHPNPVAENEKFFINLLSWAGVDRPFISSHDGNKENYVEVRLQDNKNGFVLYLFNHSDSIEDVTVYLATPKSGNYRVRDVIMDQERRIRARNNILTLETRIDARQVKVLEIW